MFSILSAQVDKQECRDSVEAVTQLSGDIAPLPFQCDKDGAYLIRYNMYEAHQHVQLIGTTDVDGSHLFSLQNC
jgi:hypothetical protein